jgi:hypothetical protein
MLISTQVRPKCLSDLGSGWRPAMRDAQLADASSSIDARGRWSSC